MAANKNPEPQRGNIIDRHPQREEIIRRLIDGEPCAKIAKGLDPPVSRISVNTYCSTVVTPALKHFIEHPESLDDVRLKNSATEDERQRIARDANKRIGATNAELAKLVDQFAMTADGLTMIAANRSKAWHNEDTPTKSIPGLSIPGNVAPVRSVFRQRLEDLFQQVTRLLERVEKSNDLTAAAPLINQAHKNIELLARVTGELENSNQGGVAIQIICPSTPGAPAQPPTVRTFNATSIPVEEIALVQR